MQYSEFILHKKTRILDDTFVLYLKPKNRVLPVFSPGQYVFLKNPLYLPEESHPFSIASSPTTKTHLEFCIKIYGDWTKKLMLLPENSTIYISEPKGNFNWDNKINHSVFLLGGIGISPVISMLRFISKSSKIPSSITILYGNRTPETIAYKKELEILTKNLPLNIIYIFSHLTENHSWKGYKGFITQDIIKNEINFSLNPTFFVVGPPVFIDLMNKFLSKLSIPSENIKKENISEIKIGNEN